VERPFEYPRPATRFALVGFAAAIALFAVFQLYVLAGKSTTTTAGLVRFGFLFVVIGSAWTMVKTFRLRVRATPDRLEIRRIGRVHTLVWNEIASIEVPQPRRGLGSLAVVVHLVDGGRVPIELYNVRKLNQPTVGAALVADLRRIGGLTLDEGAPPVADTTGGDQAR